MASNIERDIPGMKHIVALRKEMSRAVRNGKILSPNEAEALVNAAGNPVSREEELADPEAD